MTDILRLEAVTVFRGNGSVLVRYQFDRFVLRDGTLLFGIHGASADGSALRQFGLKYLDDEQIAYFVFDHVTARQTNWIDHIPTVEPTQVLAPYPSEHFDALGEQARFRGYLNVDGTDVQSDVPVEVIG
jgi:hypothetical protein